MSDTLLTPFITIHLISLSSSSNSIVLVRESSDTLSFPSAFLCVRISGIKQSSHLQISSIIKDHLQSHVQNIHFNILNGKYDQ